MPKAWSDDAIRHLTDSVTCPRCDTDGLHDRRCLNCGADLRGDIATRLWDASVAAADALRNRQAVLDLVPVAPVEQVPAGAQAVPAAAGAAAASIAAPAPAAASGVAVAVAPAPERASATVQSVLAVAGAGLFAVAAIVFTFFNPDLHDHVLRSVIVGVVTLVFLGGAWLLVRRGLRFSAEAVGALGMVFVALDIYAVSELAPVGISGWVFTAIGTLVSATIMIAAAWLARIRSWLFLALGGLAIVPAMIGYAGADQGGGTWASVLGHLGVGFGALALAEGARKLAPRFDAKLTAERVLLTVLTVLAVVVVVVQLPRTDAPTPTLHWLGIAGALAAIALLAYLSTRHLIRGFWSFLAGGFAVAALAALPFALDLEHPEWYLALVPAAAAIVVAVSALPRLPERVSLPLLDAGVFVTAGVATVITVFFAIGIVLNAMLGVLRGEDYGPQDLIGGQSGGIAVVLGVLAAAAGLGARSLVLTRRANAFSGGHRVAGAVAVGTLMLAALAFACWTAWLPVTRVAVALGIALATSLIVLFVPRVREASLALRVPAIVGAHAALVLGALLSWSDEALTVPAGIAAIAVLVPVAYTVRTADRPVHVGAGYAYALVIFARALDLTDQFATDALFSLTTVLGAAGAIAATMVRKVRAPAWYAVLIVTAVPFLIGVGIVVSSRSSWAALASGVIFLLALTLTLTRRPGLGVVMRAIAAGLLVPTLAVVVTNLAAAYLDQSGSPIALPVIAVIVAGALAGSHLIRAGLVRHGLPEREAIVARVAIEATALLTGAIAVVLALVRAAAGLGTSFLVLVIIGIGATAAAIWGRRRYGWWVAFASFTGALWCVWALQGVTLIEPYLLPPALALALIGVIVTARGALGLPLYATGLGTAIVPVLGILAITGNGEDAAVPWRAFALLAAAWLLLLIGALLGRGSREWMTRLTALRVPTLLGAIAAGAAGAIQAVRYGIGADQIDVEPYGRMLVCLGIGAVGALAAALGAWGVLRSAAPGSALARTRWITAPAVLYVAVSAVTLRPGHYDWPAIWTQWAFFVAWLLFVILIAWRVTRGRTALPPVWFVFGLAFILGVVGWSTRDLWVEWFSVPMGLALLLAGIIGMRASAADGSSDAVQPTARSLNSWPARFSGSWHLLAPGILVLFSASVIASGNPMIWRAIGVIVAALLAILIGAQLKLAAPFLLGIIVLPAENVVAFAAQIVRGQDSIPWWITLAIVGAVLLIIAVTYERRSGADNSVAARLRDLR